MTRVGPLALGALLLAGCAETGLLAQLGKSAAGSAGRTPGEGVFVVGDPYPANGVWFAPREDYALDETGLGMVVPIRRGTRTANGEAADPSRLTAQHPTLQLPAIVRVTNLETGRAVLVRVNDRGPSMPGRIIGLSEAAGRVLGIGPGGTAQLRVQVLPEESRAVAAEARARTPIPEGERLAVAAAPRMAVASEALPPPPGVRAAPVLRTAAPLPAPASAPPPVQRPPPRTDQLAQTLSQGPARPGTLWVQAGAYATAQNAERARARLAGVGPASVSPVIAAGRTLYRVRLGPAASVTEADRLLAAAVRAGANEARIVVD